MELFMLTFAALFSVINPLGTVPIFVGLTKSNSKRERQSTAFWAATNVLIILLISFFIGKYLLLFFGISLDALKIAGGLIITSSGFALLTGKFTEHKGMKKREKDDAFNRSEVTLTPLAIPMLAGPGTISLLITYNQEYTLDLDRVWIVSAIVFVSIIIYLVLRSSFLIVKILGASGINALSRIIGFIVIAIGIEYIAGAVRSIYLSLN
ncbi:MarC family protein [Crocinitomix catalasitica]|uniref:MarC family protein n=1 Tax=Crocinitomix catalasitica TaxID=184607 RepID=UPI0004848D40|nr:MarC family protein [Crocinitomix catalasitica]